MTPSVRYATAKAFHDAIKVRVATEAARGRYDINQMRRHLAYDRFLTRLFHDGRSTWVLKGGTGLLARIPDQSRHTQDIDLYYLGEIDRADAELRVAADIDLGDYFNFDIEPAGVLTEPTTGRRYKVVAYIGDTKFGDFQIDAVVDSNMTGTPDRTPGLRPIEIEGLTGDGYLTYPVVDHLADKLVAMTATYTVRRPSTRYRDLVDIVLIAQTQTVDAAELRNAVESERQHRGHTLPAQLELPDPSWARGYAAVDEPFQTSTCSTPTTPSRSLAALYQPVFEHLADGQWEPRSRRWIGLGRRA